MYFGYIKLKSRWHDPFKTPQNIKFKQRNAWCVSASCKKVFKAFLKKYLFCTHSTPFWLSYCCVRCRKNSLLIQTGVEIVWDNIDFKWMDLGTCIWYPLQILRMTSWPESLVALNAPPNLWLLLICIAYIPVSMALDSFSFHVSATSLAKGSSGFGALRRAWIDSRTVRIWRAGLHLSVVNRKITKSDNILLCFCEFSCLCFSPKHHVVCLN